MPIYAIHCDSCRTDSTIWRKVADRDNIPACPACAGVQTRRVAAPALQCAFTEYHSPATGKIIRDPRSQRYDLESTGNILNEPGLRKDVERNSEEQKEKAFAPVAAGIDAVVTNLVNERKIES